MYTFAEEGLSYEDMYPPLHRDVVCKFLTTWDPRRYIKVLLLPREHLKSTLASISLPQWLWIQRDESKWDFPCGPNTRVMLSHGKRDMAVSYLREIKRHLTENEVLRFTAPDICWDAPRKEGALWNADEFNVKRSSYSRVPSMLAAGTNASVVGFHFDWLIFDDLVFQENVGTKALREKTLTYFKQSQALLRRGGKILVIGTRWHWDDYYGTLLDPQGPYRDIVDSLVLSSGWQEGKPIFPVSASGRCGFDMARLEDRLRSMSTIEFYGQYENQPRSDEEQTFHREDIHRYHPNPDGSLPIEKETSEWVAIDPNHSQDTKRDPGVVMTASIDEDGEVWVRDIFRGHPTIRGIVHKVFDHVTLWHPRAVILETTAFQRQLKPCFDEEMLKRKQFFKVIEAKRGGKTTKEERIMVLQPLSERGGLHVPVGKEGDLLVDELCNLGSWKNDDIADALADIYTYGKRPVVKKEREEKPPESPFMMKNLLESIYRRSDRKVRRVR